MSSFAARHRIGVIAVVLLTCVGLLVLDSQGVLDPVRTGLRQVMSPFSRLTDGIVRSQKNDSDLARENDLLRQERDALVAENAVLRLLLPEVEQLRAKAEVQSNNPDWKLVTARVGFSDPANLNKMITIDKATADGIAVGMAVIDPYYFVGIVTTVYEHSAQITLSIDMTAVVGGENLYTGATGNVYGMWQQGGRLEMRHIDRNSLVRDGDLVVTATNATFSTAMVPGGIIIGVVSGDPVLDHQGDSQTVAVLPATDFDNLDVVAVIVESDPNEVAPPTPTPEAPSGSPEATNESEE